MKVLVGFPISLATLGCRDVRASTLEQSLRKLGVEKLSKDDVQKMQWETLEGKIGNWIQYMRISVSFISLGCFINSCRFSEILQGIWMPGMVCLIPNWKCSNRLPHRSPIIFAGLHICRWNSCLLRKGSFVTRYGITWTHIVRNASLMWQTQVCTCFLALGKRLLKAKSHQRSCLCCLTCMKPCAIYFLRWLPPFSWYEDWFLKQSFRCVVLLDCLRCVLGLCECIMMLSRFTHEAQFVNSADRSCVFRRVSTRHERGSNWLDKAIGTDSQRYIWRFWRCCWKRCHKNTCPWWHCASTY